MSRSDDWEERYRAGHTPWNTGRPDFNLTKMVTERPIPECKALEIGCGTGDNAMWLARSNFSVTATDISEMAIQQAKDKATAEGVECSFLVMDFMIKDIPGAPFQFVFDRGCFHSYRTGEERRSFAERVAQHLDTNGLWLSLIGSADGPAQEMGPPRLTARDVVGTVEPFLEVIFLASGHFDADRAEPPRAWVCLAQKRDKQA